MPPKYQFENVICYIFLLTLLTNDGVYANSVHTDKKYPISVSTLLNKVVLLAFQTFQ